MLLFNRAAARVFGYEPSDVVGKMSVEKLYPAGVAREVMRLIRDPNVCGPGRLEGYRVDMLNSDGERIPVMLSAALIMENDRAVGSVGIFTDIRDKLRMEAKLLRRRRKSSARARSRPSSPSSPAPPRTS